VIVPARALDRRGVLLAGGSIVLMMAGYWRACRYLDLSASFMMSLIWVRVLVSVFAAVGVSVLFDRGYRLTALYVAAFVAASPVEFVIELFASIQCLNGCGR
jgi:hypothetical protein